MTSVSNIAGAWRALCHDPVGVLWPAAAMLSLQAVGALALQRILHSGRLDALLTVFLATSLIRILLGAPLRARMLKAGARSMGLDTNDRWIALLGVHLIVGPLQLGLATGSVILGTGIAAGIAAHGLPTLATLAWFLGWLGGTLAALVIRAIFAYAPLEVLLRGCSAIQALRRSAIRGPVDTLAAALLVGFGDLAVLLGALTCGAGALPGYPISDLALLDRWRRGRTS
ncbi:MAG TPA: hypothetical protein ENK18_28590 [Deltaproteobacteria bacterium]|nr:hypothetical protein [Deltaproteobacteria bacterium]